MSELGQILPKAGFRAYTLVGKSKNVPGKDIDGSHDRAPRLISHASVLGGSLPGFGPGRRFNT